MKPSPNELASLYRDRFDSAQAYRDRVWRVLVADFFQALIPEQASVLDLGCGYGQFINHVQARQKFGMDLNPATASHLAPEVRFLRQDCSVTWELPDHSLDAVFTSNFLEHLPDKTALQATLVQAGRCLKPTGCLIALGPNIKYLPGLYWDFWDHHVALTENALREALVVSGFKVTHCRPKFLPYTMAQGPQYPLLFLRLYLRLPLAWRLLGKQFLVIAQAPAPPG
jgi:SAM-dependent methyltransferase